MAHFECAFFLLLGASITEKVLCLDCYSCNGVTDKRSCNQTTTCNSNEYCLLDKNGSLFNMRCANTMECSANGAALIGRDIASRQLTTCHECCSVDMCNRDLCEHNLPSACTDDETVDCAKMNSIFNICQDMHKAKLVCPRFCNLCTIVDGQWSLWTSWSSCDVTCDNGTEVRTRSCTNPAPANGGASCVGASTEVNSCSFDKCPVHGGWSIWSEWGSCSVTCDVGMQRRDRSCSNPYPSRYGDHCFGDSRDDRICILSGCFDGNWSIWGAWGTCSDSCGGGVKSRERTCNNPAPSPYGQFCLGGPVQTVTCNRMACPENVVAFTAYGLVANVGSELIFPNVYENRGNGYNTTTGRFTCTTPGIYYFSATLTKRWKEYTDLVICYLRLNNWVKTGSQGDPNNNNGNTDDGDGYVISFTGTFHLKRNDYVTVGGCSGQQTLHTDQQSSFTGILITPDN